MSSSNQMVMSLEDKVNVISQFEQIQDVQERIDIRNADSLLDRIVSNRAIIMRQYSIMQTQLAAENNNVGFSKTKYEAEKQSLLESVIIEWYQRAEILLGKISGAMFQEKVKMAMDMLHISSLPLSHSYLNFLKRCCTSAKYNGVKTFMSTTLSLRTIAKECIKQDMISKGYALNIYCININEDDEESENEESKNVESVEEQVLKTGNKSLEDKVNIIRQYAIMKRSQQRKIRKKNAEIDNIIANKKKILSQYTIMNGKLAIAKDRIKSNHLHDKLSLLLKIMVEWYLRANEYQLSNLGAKRITFSTVKEKTYIAFNMLRFTSIPPTQPWLNSLWRCCLAAKTQAEPEKKRSSLSLMEITKYVLEREGISKKTALTYYGIDILDEKEETIDNNQQQTSSMNSDSCDRIEIKMEGPDESNLLKNECTTADQDEEETFELYDVISIDSSDGFDTLTSTEHMIPNDLIKKELDITDVNVNNPVKQEDGSVVMTNADTAIKVEEDESQTAIDYGQDFSTETSIRQSVQDWLIQNGYEAAADPQQQALNLMKREPNSISSLELSDQIKIEDESLNNECDSVEESNNGISNMSKDEGYSIGILPLINKDINQTETPDDLMSSLSPYTVIKVEVNENQTTGDCMKDLPAASLIRASVPNWLTNNKYDTTDGIQQQPSNLVTYEDSSLIFPLKLSDRIKVEVADNSYNECDAIEEIDNRRSCLDNVEEEDESIEMFIVVDEDTMEATINEVVDDPMFALSPHTVIKVEVSESRASEDCMEDFAAATSFR